MDDVATQGLSGQLSHENAQEIYESALPEEARRLDRDALAKLYKLGVDAGADLTNTRCVTAILSGIGIAPTEVSNLTVGEGRVVAGVLMCMRGKSGEELDDSKAYGKAVGSIAISQGIPWDDAVARYKKQVEGIKEAAESLGAL